MRYIKEYSEGQLFSVYTIETKISLNVDNANKNYKSVFLNAYSQSLQILEMDPHIFYTDQLCLTFKFDSTMFMCTFVHKFVTKYKS